METEAPSAGKKRQTWLLAALGLAIVGLVAQQMWPRGESAAVATPSSNPGRESGPLAGPLDPKALKVRLDALEAKGPDPGQMERNPFRFKPLPPPPTPPKPIVPPTPIGPPQPVTPPAPIIPPIPLKFMGTVEKGTLKLAALTDCKGYTYAAREGDPVDGRYKLVKIGEESVQMEYMNGTGRQTIPKSGECRK